MMMTKKNFQRCASMLAHCTVHCVPCGDSSGGDGEIVLHLPQSTTRTTAVCRGLCFFGQTQRQCKHREWVNIIIAVALPICYPAIRVANFNLRKRHTQRQTQKIHRDCNNWVKFQFEAIRQQSVSEAFIIPHKHTSLAHQTLAQTLFRSPTNIITTSAPFTAE